MNTGEIQSLLRVNEQFKKTNYKIKGNGNHKQQHCIPFSEKLMADFKPPVNHRTDTHYRQYSGVSLEDGVARRHRGGIYTPNPSPVINTYGPVRPELLRSSP